MLKKSELKKIIHYNPETGIFTRIRLTNKQFKLGVINNKIAPNGYIYSRIKNELFTLHQLAFLYMVGLIPEQVDHINHIRDDNRWHNLKGSSSSENNKNRTMARNNTSGFTGVTFDKKRNRWVSQIGLGGLNKKLGTFKCKHDAIAARKEANVKYGFHVNHGKKLCIITSKDRKNSTAECNQTGKRVSHE